MLRILNLAKKYSETFRCPDTIILIFEGTVAQARELKNITDLSNRCESRAIKDNKKSRIIFNFKKLRNMDLTSLLDNRKIDLAKLIKDKLGLKAQDVNKTVDSTKEAISNTFVDKV